MSFFDTSRMTANWTFAGRTDAIAVQYEPSELNNKAPMLTPVSHDLADFAATTSSSVLDELLFDNAANLKRDMSQYAMHLDVPLRDWIRSRIDALLSLDNWEEDSSAISQTSFATFLRFITATKPQRLPSLGVSPAGHVLASWWLGDKRLYVEFMPSEIAKASVVRPTERNTAAQSDVEYLGWQGRVANLMSFIKRNGAADCLT